MVVVVMKAWNLVKSNIGLALTNAIETSSIIVLHRKCPPNLWLCILVPYHSRLWRESSWNDYMHSLLPVLVWSHSVPWLSLQPLLSTTEYHFFCVAGALKRARVGHLARKGSWEAEQIWLNQCIIIYLVRVKFYMVVPKTQEEGSRKAGEAVEITWIQWSVNSWRLSTLEASAVCQCYSGH